MIINYNPGEGEDNKKKLEVLSKIDELKVIANNHYLMGKFDEAIKIAEEIMDIAEQARLYSIVREEGEYIANLYKQAKEEHKYIAIRDDFESLEREFYKLVGKGNIEEAHDLVQTFKQLYKNIDLNSFSNVNMFLSRDSKIWNEFITREQNLIRQLDPLEIQFNSYVSTNNLSLAGETLEQAKTLLKKLTNSRILKMWETSEIMYLELRKRYVLNEIIEKDLNEVSKLTENYEFDKAKRILDSKIEYLEKEGLSEYNKDIEAKKIYILDAESKYLKLEDELKALEELIKDNITHNHFKQAISNIGQIIKISRFIGKTKNIERFDEYINLLEKKIRLGAEAEKIANRVKKLNLQAIGALRKEDYDNSLLIFKEIIELIKTKKPQ
ncbi:MAG: hypothetical protein E3J90_08025 [Promethearchaeota archaeon]|nr:MAG: hypothetical protein E3J90_08025 [Candidatus Lokiarchaeota archaeon]